MKRTDLLKTTLIAAASVAMLSCSNSYPGEIYDVRLDPSVFNTETEEAERNQQEPIKMFINEQSFFSIKARGLGAFDQTDALWNERMSDTYFGIYAFRNDRGMLSTSDPTGQLDELKNPTNMQKWALAENGPAGLKDDSRLHCLLDGKDYNYGLQMRLNPEASNGQLKDYGTDPIAPSEWKKAKDTIYYYPAAQKVPYDFFCYYFDDAKVTPHRNNTDYIHYDVEIDGTQDIMIGQAKDIRDVINDKDFFKKHEDVSLSDAKLLLDIGGYCGMAAHRGIHPEIQLDHLCTQLKFEAYPGSERAKDITINSIKVYAPYKGDVTVATKDTINHPIGVVWQDDPSVTSNFIWYSLHEKPTFDVANQKMEACQVMAPIALPTFDKTKEAVGKNPIEQGQPHVDLGGGIVLPVRDNYTMEISCVQQNVVDYEGNVKSFPYSAQYNIKFPDNRIFEAGNYYIIQIVVYGLEEIKIKVSITPWVKGDDVPYIDPEDYG